MSGAVDPQPRLMLRPSGVDADAAHVETHLAKQTRRHRGRRAVRAVDGDAHPLRAMARRQDVPQVIEILGAKIELLDRTRQRHPAPTTTGPR